MGLCVALPSSLYSYGLYSYGLCAALPGFCGPWGLYSYGLCAALPGSFSSLCSSLFCSSSCVIRCSFAWSCLFASSSRCRILKNKQRPQHETLRCPLSGLSLSASVVNWAPAVFERGKAVHRTKAITHSIECCRPMCTILSRTRSALGSSRCRSDT